jgi:hypothetical protein
MSMKFHGGVLAVFLELLLRYVILNMCCDDATLNYMYSVAVFSISCQLIHYV